MTDRKGIGGRPREGENVKKAALNFRTDPELYARVRMAAEARGRSLTQEVEQLVRLGLDVEDGEHRIGG